MSTVARRLLARKRLSSVNLEATPTVIAFQASGLTSNQWRKLKNLLSPGKTSFRPSFSDATGKESRFFQQLAHSSGPACITYLGEDAASKVELLPSWSADQELLLLYGQHQSSFVNHVDVGKVDEADGMDSSLFDFFLPSSYLCSSLDPPQPSG